MGKNPFFRQTMSQNIYLLIRADYVTSFTYFFFQQISVTDFFSCLTSPDYVTSFTYFFLPTDFCYGFFLLFD